MDAIYLIVNKAFLFLLGGYYGVVNRDGPISIPNTKYSILSVPGL